jgi:hypothetical protein
MTSIHNKVCYNCKPRLCIRQRPEMKVIIK